MKKESITYQAGSTLCQGLVAYEEGPQIKPLVLIAPTWQGLNHFAEEQALALAKLGYVAFAIDLYGHGASAKTDEEAADLMLPLFLNRALLRERVEAAYTHALKLPLVDQQRVGAIGFCFGGLCVIELFRSGVRLRGVVSLHGVLGDTFMGAKAKLAPAAAPLQGSLLILHGAKDPLVPMEDLLKLQKEMSAAKVDWQTVIYGNAGHAFTNPELKDSHTGLYFEPLANARSFQAMRNFFEEKFT